MWRATWMEDTASGIITPHLPDLPDLLSDDLTKRTACPNHEVPVSAIEVLLQPHM